MYGFEAGVNAASSMASCIRGTGKRERQADSAYTNLLAHFRRSPP
jgi:hypothetical protein